MSDTLYTLIDISKEGMIYLKDVEYAVIVWDDNKKYYYHYGKLHCLHRPALVWQESIREEIQEYWYTYGNNITNTVNKWFQKHNTNWKTWSEEEKLLFRLEFS